MTEAERDQPMYVTAKTAGTMLGGAHVKVVYRLAHSGAIPYVRLGKRKLLFSVKALEALARQQIASS